MSQVIGIFGIRGGGTSAIAGVVKLHGYQMWGAPRTLDDNIFCKDGKPDYSVLSERTGNWAFKHPYLTPHINDIKDHIPDLKCIYVFRDPVASAEHGAGRSKAVIEADHAMQKYMLNGPYGLYVSYERAITRRKETVEQIAEYLGAPFNPNAVNWLDPSLKYRPIADYE